MRRFTAILINTGARLTSGTARPAGRRARNRVAVGAAAAVLCVIAGAGAAQGQVTAPGAQARAAAHGPGHPAGLAGLPGVRVVNLHKQYLAQLRRVKVGKVAGIFRPRGWRPPAAAKVHTAGCTEPDCPLLYRGGSVQHNPQVFTVWWGPNWKTDSSQLASLAYIGNLYGGLGALPQDTWSPITAQYGDSTGFPQFTGSVGVAGYVDTSTPPTGATKTQLAAEAAAAAANAVGAGYTINGDSQIVVATQSGTCPQGFSAPGKCPPGGANCAYHSAFTSGSFTNEPFVNLPYVLDAGPNCGENAVNSGSAGTHDGFSIVGGHEYAETITDPNPGTGWYDPSDPSGGEIGDKCVIGTTGNPPVGNVTTSDGTFAMQSLWSNAASKCVLAAAPGDTVSVTSPGTQKTATTNDPVNLPISGSSSGSHPLQWYAPSLPPGLSINPSTGVISGNATTAGTYTPTIYASDDTGATGSASFEWDVVNDSVTVTNPGTQTGYAQAKASLQLTATSSGGFTPFSWQASGLPKGLKLNASTGKITGAPTTAGSYTVSVAAFDTLANFGKTSFTWTVNPDVGNPVQETSALLCLNDNGSKATAGNPVTVATCKPSGAQDWTFATTGAGQLTVFGLCLSDPKSGGTGTTLALAACKGATSETWTHQANGEYVLGLNGLCLTDPGDSTTSGTKVTITACAAATSQQWSLP